MADINIREALLSPAVVLIAGVVLSAFLIPIFGWPGLAPLVLAGLGVVIWMHALIAAVENQWNELRSINWNSAMPKKPAERRKFIEELRANITNVLRPAVERVGGLLKASLLIGALGLVSTFVIRAAYPEVAMRLAAARAPLLMAAGLILLLMMSLAWSILRLRKAAGAVGEVFAAMERALEG